MYNVVIISVKDQLIFACTGLKTLLGILWSYTNIKLVRDQKQDQRTGTYLETIKTCWKYTWMTHGFRKTRLKGN